MPLIVILALLGGLAAYYGPGIIAAQRFRATANAMLDDVRSGRLQNLPSYVETAQRPVITALLSEVPTGYHNDIETLRLTSLERDGQYMWAIVTARGGKFLGQGKLRWRWDGQEWCWDPLSTYLAEGVNRADSAWTPLDEYLQAYHRGAY